MSTLTLKFFFLIGLVFQTSNAFQLDSDYIYFNLGLGIEVAILPLSNLGITSVAEDAFIELTELTSIDLSGNLLETLEPATFENQGATLRTLILDRNQITTLPADVFRGLTGLDNVELARNRLTNLDASIFQDLIGVNYIDLANNQLTGLPPNIFDGLPELDRIDLQFNRLTSVDVGIFNSLVELDYLYLQNNEIATISPNAFDVSYNEIK